MSNPLIPVVFDGRHLNPPRIICCIGYELKRWRSEKLSEFIFDLIPQFVLTDEEQQLIDPVRPYSTLIKAVRRFQSPDNDQPRGEIGELLAHYICSQEFGTKQFVARLYYKMRSNDQVTGFDMVHLRYIPASDEIELWLGEAKIHQSLSGAISKTLRSLQDHIDHGFLREAKSLIGPKISRSDPYFDKLQWIFHEDTVLDEVVDRLIVPVFIAADTKCESSGDFPLHYDENIRKELDHIVDRVGHKFGVTLSLVFIYFPLNTKKLLDSFFHRKLGAFGGI